MEPEVIAYIHCVIVRLNTSSARSYTKNSVSSCTLSPFQDTLYEGTISRDQVAEVAVEALVHPEASYKVVEIVARNDAPKRSYEDLFGSIKQR